jgi:hypothetical protein
MKLDENSKSMVSNAHDSTYASIREGQLVQERKIREERERQMNAKMHKQIIESIAPMKTE